MAATVRPIEAKSVHQIQSGQVIVDLCSVVKELVENSLDAGASSVEVRFKNNGLDEIEVQDNGAGIAAVNYENVALKHYTSKLSTYDDLSSLQTFGFRGEALSSLCALSDFTITTAQADEAPKGQRLEFEVSGKLKCTTITACQKGTTATVQGLFETLPVRRKELSKNIKREYGKVLGLLHAYACISTNVKFMVKNAMPKGKGVTVFATKSNATTRENIANIYGAKTLLALVALDLDFNFPQLAPQLGQDVTDLTEVAVRGHISKPVFGEGRQTPDRQMFFVNGRPCGLPQIAKAINEVYKSFNVSQSPFVFADFQMDTGAYDVNVSPDKRTIFLHNATALIEGLKNSLTELFDQQEQTVPQSHVQTTKLPAFKQLNPWRPSSAQSPQRSSLEGLSNIEQSDETRRELETVISSDDDEKHTRLLHQHFQKLAGTREKPSKERSEKEITWLARARDQRESKLVSPSEEQDEDPEGRDEEDSILKLREQLSRPVNVINGSKSSDIQIRDFNARMAEQRNRKRLSQDDKVDTEEFSEAPVATLLSLPKSSSTGPVPDAFDRIRPRRSQPEVATITIGDRTITRIVGAQISTSQGSSRADQNLHDKQTMKIRGKFAQGIQKFGAPGTQPADQESGESSDAEASSPQSQESFDEPSVVNEDETVPPLSNEESIEESGLHHIEDRDSLLHDPDYVDEDAEKAAESNRVSKLIRLAENHAAERSKQGEKRVTQAFKGARAKDSTTALAVQTELDLEEIKALGSMYRANINSHNRIIPGHHDYAEETVSDEEQLSLTVSKSDFLNMHVVGQFNLGFILAVRPKHLGSAGGSHNDKDELFIIDQHASDEKYNFERLQAETIVSNQRMVRPATLDMTAVEEEIVIDNTVALEKNGFVVEVDVSGEQAVGSRCRLVSLPLSKEVVFGTKDLEELIQLLAESPMLNDASPVPRPSKVRKMFAMRACRSSIMIGKTLSRKQMTTILKHMGSINKPWNCPHGRPTMRHLASIDALDTSLWREGDGVDPGKQDRSSGLKSVPELWRSLVVDS